MTAEKEIEDNDDYFKDVYTTGYNAIKLEEQGVGANTSISVFLFLKTECVVSEGQKQDTFIKY